MSLKDFGSNTFYGAKYDDQFEHTFKTFTAIQAENKKGLFHLRPSIYWNRSMDRFELFRNAPEKYAFNYHRTDVYGVNLNAFFDWTLGRTAFGAELRHENLVSGNLGELSTVRNTFTEQTGTTPMVSTAQTFSLYWSTISFSIASHCLLASSLSKTARLT